MMVVCRPPTPAKAAGAARVAATTIDTNIFDDALMVLCDADEIRFQRLGQSHPRRVRKPCALYEREDAGVAPRVQKLSAPFWARSQTNELRTEIRRCRRGSASDGAASSQSQPARVPHRGTCWARELEWQ